MQDGVGAEGVYMTTEEAIGILQARISKAVIECEAWRQTGLSENYMEAYDLVEALQLQLRRRLRLPAAREVEAASPLS